RRIRRLHAEGRLAERDGRGSRTIGAHAPDFRLPAPRGAAGRLRELPPAPQRELGLWAALRAGKLAPRNVQPHRSLDPGGPRALPGSAGLGALAAYHLPLPTGGRTRGP